MAHETLVTLFVDALPAERHREARAIPGLGDTLASLIDAARTLAPGVLLDASTFVRYVAERAASAEDLGSALAATRGPDLFIACGAAHGDVRAVAMIDEQLRARVPAALRRMRLSESAVDDVLQRVRMKLLVGEGGRSPKIAEYAGRGPLGGWLRVVALRAGLDGVRRGPAEENEDDVLAGLVASTPDAETELARRRHAAVFKEVFIESVESVGERERVLLRLHFVDSLSIDEIGTIYRIHRATAARWVAEARALLLREIRTRLRARLGVSDTALNSVMRGVRSQIDISLSGFFERRE